MNKKPKALSIFAVIAMLFNLTAYSVSAAGNDVTVNGNEMYNEYIKMSVDKFDGLRMSTVKGDPDNPNDDGKKLLYGDYYSTSYTVINVDGKTQKYSSMYSRNNTGGFDPENKTHWSTRSYKDIDIRQNYSFVKNNATGREDLVEIKYTLTNNDNKNHSVGVKIMIDTMLGENDFAPFRIPNVGAVETEMSFYGDEIPEYYQAFDYFENTSVVSFGTFDKISSNKADFVQFIGWPRSNSAKWDVSTKEGKLIGDSSVVSVWNTKELAPGETRVYKMYYGLGRFVADTTGELQLACYGHTTAKINESNTGYEPSTITAYLKNSSENTLENVTVTLNNTDEMTIIGGDKTISVGSLAGGEEKQVSWTVDFQPSDSTKTVEYSVTANADNAEEKTVDLSTELPCIEKPEPTTAEPTTVEPTTVEPTTVEPTTVEPTTVEPTTVEPTTVEPTTAEPTTVEPTTAEPTTVEPTTAEPTTVEPTTAEPTTVEPTTAEPTTVEPTTAEPTTAEPTTFEPTTVEPTTAEPTTTEPTTAEPTEIPPTTAQSSGSCATPDEPHNTSACTPVTANRNAIQTGSVSLLAVLLAALASATGMAIFIRKKTILLNKTE